MAVHTHTHTHTSLLNENIFKNTYYDMEKNVKNILTGLHFYCKSICVAQNKKLKRKRWFRQTGSFNLNEPIWRIKKQNVSKNFLDYFNGI